MTYTANYIDELFMLPILYYNSFSNGGGGGNRTHVRESIAGDLYERSRNFDLTVKTPFGKILYGEPSCNFALMSNGQTPRLSASVTPLPQLTENCGKTAAFN